MNRSGVKAFYVLAIVGIMSMPFQSQAFSLDDAVMTYVRYLKAQIVTLKAENVRLKAENVRLRSQVADKVDEVAQDTAECDALAEDVAAAKKASLEYQAETERLVKEVDTYMAGAGASPVNTEKGRIVSNRHHGYLAGQDKYNALSTKWYTECK